MSGELRCIVVECDLSCCVTFVPVSRVHLGRVSMRARCTSACGREREEKWGMPRRAAKFEFTKERGDYGGHFRGREKVQILIFRKLGFGCGHGSTAGW